MSLGRYTKAMNLIFIWIGWLMTKYNIPALDVSVIVQRTGRQLIIVFDH